MTLTQFATVADVMTRKIVTLSEQDVLNTAEYGMHRMHFRHLPVVDGNGKLLGILSHGDLLHAASSSLSDKETERNELILQQPVRRIMQREVLTVQPGDSLIQAGKVLWESKIGCLPVVDADGALVGMLTKSDFIRVALQLMGSDVKREDVEDLARATSQASGIARAG
jgi:CBS domain-containing membrane protein